MQRNPFDPGFTTIPPIYLEPNYRPEDMLNDHIFNQQHNQIIFITGHRASGKSVYLTKTEKLLKPNPNYRSANVLSMDHVEQNLVSDFLEDLPNKARLHKVHPDLKTIIKHFNQSNITPILIIDETYNHQSIRDFIIKFNHFEQEGLHAHLIMAGLLYWIDELKAERSVGFLNRATTILMTPFNNQQIANAYQKAFNCDDQTTNYLAQQVGGFAYAFQLYGSCIWEELQKDKLLKQAIQDALKPYQKKLYQTCYTAIVSDTTEKEQEFIHLAAEYYGDLNKIIQEADQSKSEIKKDQQLLIQRRIIKINHNQVEFLLPQFATSINNIDDYYSYAW